MKKEQLKSIILTALILNAIFLTTQIWFDKKLWPNGYNFFHSLKEVPIVGQIFDRFDLSRAAQNASTFEDITLPYRMIVSNSNRTRTVHHQDTNEYNIIKNNVLSVKDMLYASELPQYMVISSNEWFSSLKGNSIMLDYGTIMKTKLMAQARNMEDTSLVNMIDGFSEIIITPNDGEANAVFVYIRDLKNEIYYRFTISHGRQELRNLIDSYSGQKQQNFAFAFELNLHKTEKNEEEPVNRMYLDPLVLLPLEMIEKQPILHMENPFLKDVNPSVYEHVVQAFGMQPNNLRRSVSADGMISYIENKATIEISPKGRIDYKAVDQKSGILAETLYDKINLIWEIANKQWNVSVLNQPFNARINSDLSMDSHANSTITMNYLYRGVPIILDASKSGYGSCISAEFVENRLIRFSMLVRSVQSTEEYSDAAFVLEALDNIYSKVQTNDVIKNVFMCYIMNEQEQALDSAVTWAVKQSGRTYIAD